MPVQEKNKIEITSIRPIEPAELISYLDEHLIDVNVAKKYCQEVDFELDNKLHTTIGFKNDTGGFALQNADFKGKAGVQFTTLFSDTKGYNRLSVFENFVDFLLYQSGHQPRNVYYQLPQSQAGFLILNHLSFFE